MARVQVLPLPTVRVGKHEHTRFVVIVDSFTDEQEMAGFNDPDLIKALRENLGATAVWVCGGTLDVGTPLHLTEQQQQDILDRIEATTT